MSEITTVGLDLAKNVFVSLKCGEAERSTCSLGMRQIRRRRAEPTNRTSNLAEALLRCPLNVGLRRCGPAALIEADRPQWAAHVSILLKD